MTRNISDQQQYLERDRTIVTLYTNGQTLAQIGQTYNITRERVRQILAANGVERRGPGKVPADGYATWAREHGDAIEAELRAHANRKTALAAIHAVHPELPITWLRRLCQARIERTEWAGRYQNLSRYSDDELIAALRRYATDGHISGKRYEALANPTTDPSRSTFTLRWGSWSAALEAAGLTPNPTRRSYERTWTTDELLDVIRRYIADAQQAGRHPSIEEYLRWRYHQPTRQPSLSTLRNQTGLGWNGILKAANA